MTQINNALANLKYLPPIKYTGSDSLNISFNDQGNNSTGTPVVVSKTINLTVANVGLFNLDPVSANTYFIGSNVPITIDDNVVVSSANLGSSGSFAGVYPSFVLTRMVNGVATPNAEDVFKFNLPSSNIGGTLWTPSNSAQGSWIYYNNDNFIYIAQNSAGRMELHFYNSNSGAFNSNADLVSKLLQSLQYTNTNTTNPASSITLGYNLHNNSMVATTTINVLPVFSSPPTINAPATALTVSGNDMLGSSNKILFTGGNSISVSDLQTKALDSNNYEKVTLTVTNGALHLDNIQDLTILAGANDSSSISLYGNLAKINSALANLSYAPKLNYYGTDKLTVTFDDRGNNSANAGYTITKDINLTVVAPSISNLTTTTYIAGSQPVVISNSVYVTDVIRDVLNNNQGDYGNNSTLTIYRTGNSSGNAQDQFSFNLPTVNAGGLWANNAGTQGNWIYYKDARWR